MAISERTPWRRLLRNKIAMAGLLVIGFAIFVAVFAYFIVPDPSPDANRIIVEIGGQKPGFRQLFLKLPKPGMVGHQSFSDILIHGRRERWDYIPVNSYRWDRDSLIVDKYVD